MTQQRYSSPIMRYNGLARTVLARSNLQVGYALIWMIESYLHPSPRCQNRVRPYLDSNDTLHIHDAVGTPDNLPDVCQPC